jgi:hypothetical protein
MHFKYLSLLLWAAAGLMVLTAAGATASTPAPRPPTSLGDWPPL